MAGARGLRAQAWAAAVACILGAGTCAPAAAASWNDGENALVTPAPGPVEPPPLPDDACLEAIRGICCPEWRRYAIFDVLFLQRNNAAGDQTLVADAATGLPAITVQDLQPAVATGVRLFYGSLFTDDLGWEIGYLGVYGMFGQATATGPDTLEMPPPLGLAVNNFNNAESARATYWSTLNMAEVNLFRYDCCQECGPTGCRPPRGVSAGTRRRCRPIATAPRRRWRPPRRARTAR